VAVEEHLASTDFDPEQFTPADQAALSGEWSWLGDVAGKAQAGDRSGEVADELALVVPWGFEPRQVAAPVLLLHGGQDRIAPSAHGAWLARQIRSAELWLRPEDGHISVLNSGATALDWLWEHAGPG
jgi:pimeloyl-ACP methyl ester carboxylesterase